MDIIESMDATVGVASAVIANVGSDQLGASTPCTDWDVRALLNHLIGGAYMVRDLGRDGQVDLAAMADDFVGSDPQAAWAEASREATEAWRGDGVLAKTVTMPWGAQLPAPAALTILRNDLFQHSWDLARATGQSTDLDADVAADVWAAIQENPAGIDPFRQMGLFGPAVEVAGDAPLADRVAGYFGRTP
ncbi:MAG: TIGR03086 family protein [Acidimicrobiia bacterium]|nr:TIGR03086 family protein [Acidimicrobiia bacterium]